MDKISKTIRPAQYLSITTLLRALYAPTVFVGMLGLATFITFFVFGRLVGGDIALFIIVLSVMIYIAYHYVVTQYHINRALKTSSLVGIENIIQAVPLTRSRKMRRKMLKKMHSLIISNEESLQKSFSVHKGVPLSISFWDRLALIVDVYERYLILKAYSRDVTITENEITQTVLGRYEKTVDDFLSKMCSYPYDFEKVSRQFSDYKSAFLKKNKHFCYLISRDEWWRTIQGKCVKLYIEPALRAKLADPDVEKLLPSHEYAVYLLQYGVLCEKWKIPNVSSEFLRKLGTLMHSVFESSSEAEKVLFVKELIKVKRGKTITEYM